MVAALVLGTSGEIRGGSSPLSRTNTKLSTLLGAILFFAPRHFRFTPVPGAGLEPARPYGHKILSLAWLPITPPGQLVCVYRKRVFS